MRQEDRKKALIIAVSKYENRKFNSLDFCENDGKRIYNILKSQGYEIPDNNFLMGDVKYEQVRNAIREFFKGEDVKTKDTLLFYYTGHGYLDNKGYHFLVSSEMDPSNPDDKGYLFDELTRITESSNSLRKILILDCCHAGGIKIRGKGKAEEEKGEAEAAKLDRQAISEAVKRSISVGQGTCILASSLGVQKSFKLPEKNYSAFSYFIIEGLEGRASDDYGHVTPQYLASYATEGLLAVPQLRQQNPITRIEIVGKLVLTNYPTLAKMNLVKSDEHQSEIIRRLVTRPLAVSSLLARGYSGSRLKDALYGKPIYWGAGLPLAKGSILAIFIPENAKEFMPQHRNRIPFLFHVRGAARKSQESSWNYWIPIGNVVILENPLTLEEMKDKRYFKGWKLPYSQFRGAGKVIRPLQYDIPERFWTRIVEKNPSQITVLKRNLLDEERRRERKRRTKDPLK